MVPADTRIPLVVGVAVGPGVFFGALIPSGLGGSGLMLMGIALSFFGGLMAFAAGRARSVGLAVTVGIWCISGVLGYSLIFLGA